MIDANAFAEWLVAKASKHGADASDENMRVAREAVEAALATGGDDVHVRCALTGASGPVQIDEHMTHTAAETLFPKVAMAEPLPGWITHEEKRKPTPVHTPVHKPKPPPVEDVPAPAKTQRTAVVIAIVVLLCACAAALGAHLAKDGDHHEDDKREKRESRH